MLKKIGVELIAVVLGSVGAENRTNDVKALFEYGFEKLKAVKFFSAGEIVENIKVPGGTLNSNQLAAVTSNNVVHTIPSDKSVSDYPPEITFNEDLKAPISSGETVGKITYKIDNNTYEHELIASNNVDSFIESVASVAVKTTKAIGKIIFWAVLSIIGIVIALVFLRASIITKRQRSRRARTARYNSRFR